MKSSEAIIVFFQGSLSNLDPGSSSVQCSRMQVRNVFRTDYSSMRRTGTKSAANERAIDVLSLSGGVICSFIYRFRIYQEI